MPRNKRPAAVPRSPASSEIDELVSSDPNVSTLPLEIQCGHKVEVGLRRTHRNASANSPPRKHSESPSSRLDHFRCSTASRARPPSDVMNSSPRSNKRARSPRLLESPIHTAISTSSPLEPEPRAEGRKKHKQANETVQDPPALYYLPEVDEDGNPVEDEPPPACKIPSPVLSHARIPFRPVSPAKRSSGQVALNSARSAVASPRPSVSPSIKDHAAQAAKPLDQVSTTPFSSSFDLPDQIARRIRQTSASCSPSRTLSSEAVSPADQSLFDELGSRDTARQQEQSYEIKRHGQQQAGEMSGQIEPSELANTLVELPLESGSGHPPPLSGTSTLR